MISNQKVLINFRFCRHRKPKDQYQWWMKLRQLLRILAKHESVYNSEIIKDESTYDDIESEEEVEDPVKSAAKSK